MGNNILSDATAFLCDYNNCAENLIHWSILRPTCRALESNQLVGPLLTNDTLLSQYTDHVQDFVQGIMMNQTFLDQVLDHLKAIKDEVAKDPWNDMAEKFDVELEQNSDKWRHYFYGTVPYIPFLSAMRARSTDIMNQLDAISKNKLPRSPSEIQSWETCVNWKQAEPPKTICHANCYYEGCYRPEFTIPAWCDEARRTCIHGISDNLCEGVENLKTYPGMENSFEGSNKQAFCWNDETLGPVRIADCPEPTSDAATFVINSFMMFVTFALTGLFSVTI